MAFCTNCGGRVADESRFCPNCGQAVGAPAGTGASGPVAGAAASYGYAPTSPQPLDYTIQGDNLQIARVRLKPGQEIYAEAGKMVYKTPSVEWDTRMQGESIGEKIWGAVKRKLMGESLFLTYFKANMEGEVGFAGNYPGRVQSFELAPGQSVLVQRDAFLFAQSSVQLNIALVKKLGAGFFGGEGFILEKLTGPGSAFIHAGGDFIEFNLAAGETIQIDTGCIVAFDDGMNYDIQFVGGIKRALFGGEGLFLATVSGPGRVIVQSMTIEKMRREIVGNLSGNGRDERTGLDAISGLFGNND